MKKLAIYLKRGDKVEFLNGEVGVIETVIVDELMPQHTTIYYKNGSRNFCLPDDEIEIIDFIVDLNPYSPTAKLGKT
jgi:hypothetical protein